MSQQAEILTTSADFVRTASESKKSDQFQDWIDQAGTVAWTTAMKRSVRDSATLRRLLDLPPADDDNQSFPTFVPLEFLRRINPGDLSDPLLRQVLPIGLEDQPSDLQGFQSDPVGDLDAVVTPGLLHKYHGRALIVSTGACGVHCRYCFRREFPYYESRMIDVDGVIGSLRSDDSIEEVLLSGGDPLTLRDEVLFDLMDRIESIDHVRRLRFHTRMPIVIPSRITTPLVTRLRQSRLTVWFVVHANHAAEWDATVSQAVGQLVDAGIPVLNQSVLLSGVNDDVDSLVELSQAMINDRVTPYYLHQLDRVRGASHFEVEVSRGKELIDEMRKRLPGYAVPQYVTEQPGESSKRPL